MSSRLGAGVAAAALVLVAACGGSSNSSGSATTSAAGLVGSVTTSGISADRCAANRAAGKITYLSGFDFAASASIVEVVMAKAKGYFDTMCLDVDLKSGFSTTDYPVVAAGTAQFASAGSYSEVLTYTKSGAAFTAVVDDGKTAINTLLVKPDIGVTTPADLKGKTIGVLGAMPASVIAMLNKAGVTSSDYKTIQLNGFDPVAQFHTDIAGRPGFQSNEPGILQRAGVKFLQFDPSSEGIPGSFGVIYTSQDFLAKHPTAVQDFVRASMKGLADAIGSPDATVAECLKLIQTAGNQNGLTAEGETFRWKTEAGLVTSTTPKGEPLGLIDPGKLEAEVAAYKAASAYDGPSDLKGTYDTDLVKGVYNATGSVIWPSA